MACSKILPITVAVQRGPVSVVISRPRSVARLADLQRAIGEHFARMGYTHWGAELDLAILSETVNRGFLVLSDTAQGGQCCIKNYGATRADYPFWILLYHRGDVHYQLAGLRAGLEGDARLAFHNALTDMPAALASEWERCTQLPLGQTSLGGFS